MVISLPKIVASIDEDNSARVQIDVVGKYKTVGAGAIFDSGFTGDIVIPESMAVDIGLNTAGAAEIELADGSKMMIDLYLCKAKIGDVTQDAATIIMGNEVLIGMGLMRPFNICMSMDTSEVIIEHDPVADYVGVLHRLTGS